MIVMTSKLVGNQYYTLPVGSKIAFTNFDEDGNELGEQIVLTKEPVTVFINQDIEVAE